MAEHGQVWYFGPCFFQTFYFFSQEDYDHVSLEDQHYQGDGSMLSPKAKLLLRDSKKELLRYVTLKNETSRGIHSVKCE